jgi:hypothetical protein
MRPDAGRDGPNAAAAYLLQQIDTLDVGRGYSEFPAARTKKMRHGRSRAARASPINYSPLEPEALSG